MPNKIKTYIFLGFYYNNKKAVKKLYVIILKVKKSGPGFLDRLNIDLIQQNWKKIRQLINPCRAASTCKSLWSCSGISESLGQLR